MMGVPADDEIDDILTRMEEPATLGRLIREARLEKGLSLGQLASRVGRSSSSVRRWERDEVAPAIGILPDLADALGLDVADLQRLRPSAVDPDTDPSTLGDRPPVESPVVPGAPPNGTIVTQDPLPIAAAPSASRSGGILEDVSSAIFGNRESWIGWVRGILTAVVLVVMFFVLVWALGELADAVLEVLRSFDVGGAG